MEGLTAREAERRLAEQGPNELVRGEHASPWKFLASQFKGALIWLLLGACVISAALGEVADAVAIGAILLLNALVGFFQEYRAERAVLALRAMSAPRARVQRDGRSLVIPAAEVVRGDMLLLEAGDVVAADGRLREAHGLQTVESLLTGESEPVEKQTTPTGPQTLLADRLDCVFLGTAVAIGRRRSHGHAHGDGQDRQPPRGSRGDPDAFCNGSSRPSAGPSSSCASESSRSSPWPG